MAGRFTKLVNYTSSSITQQIKTFAFWNITHKNWSRLALLHIRSVNTSSFSGKCDTDKGLEIADQEPNSPTKLRFKLKVPVEEFDSNLEQRKDGAMHPKYPNAENISNNKDAQTADISKAWNLSEKIPANPKDNPLTGRSKNPKQKPTVMPWYLDISSENVTSGKEEPTDALRKTVEFPKNLNKTSQEKKVENQRNYFVQSEKVAEKMKKNNKLVNLKKEKDAANNALDGIGKNKESFFINANASVAGLSSSKAKHSQETLQCVKKAKKKSGKPRFLSDKNTTDKNFTKEQTMSESSKTRYSPSRTGLKATSDIPQEKALSEIVPRIGNNSKQKVQMMERSFGKGKEGNTLDQINNVKMKGSTRHLLDTNPTVVKNTPVTCSGNLSTKSQSDVAKRNPASMPRAQRSKLGLIVLDDSIRQADMNKEISSLEDVSSKELIIESKPENGRASSVKKITAEQDATKSIKSKDVIKNDKNLKPSEAVPVIVSSKDVFPMLDKNMPIDFQLEQHFLKLNEICARINLDATRNILDLVNRTMKNVEKELNEITKTSNDDPGTEFRNTISMPVLPAKPKKTKRPDAKITTKENDRNIRQNLGHSDGFATSKLATSNDLAAQKQGHQENGTGFVLVDGPSINRAKRGEKEPANTTKKFVLVQNPDGDHKANDEKRNEIVCNDNPHVKKAAQQPRKIDKRFAIRSPSKLIDEVKIARAFYLMGNGNPSDINGQERNKKSNNPTQTLDAKKDHGNVDGRMQTKPEAKKDSGTLGRSSSSYWTRAVEEKVASMQNFKGWEANSVDQRKNKRDKASKIENEKLKDRAKKNEEYERKLDELFNSYEKKPRKGKKKIDKTKKNSYIFPFFGSLTNRQAGLADRILDGISARNSRNKDTKQANSEISQSSKANKVRRSKSEPKSLTSQKQKPSTIFIKGDLSDVKKSTSFSEPLLFVKPEEIVQAKKREEKYSSLGKSKRNSSGVPAQIHAKKNKSKSFSNIPEPTEDIADHEIWSRSWLGNMAEYQAFASLDQKMKQRQAVPAVKTDQEKKYTVMKVNLDDVKINSSSSHAKPTNNNLTPNKIIHKKKLENLINSSLSTNAKKEISQLYKEEFIKQQNKELAESMAIRDSVLRKKTESSNKSIKIPYQDNQNPFGVNDKKNSHTKLSRENSDPNNWKRSITSPIALPSEDTIHHDSKLVLNKTQFQKTQDYADTTRRIEEEKGDTDLFEEWLQAHNDNFIGNLLENGFGYPSDTITLSSSQHPQKARTGAGETKTPEKANLNLQKAGHKAEDVNCPKSLQGHRPKSSTIGYNALVQSIHQDIQKTYLQKAGEDIGCIEKPRDALGIDDRATYALPAVNSLENSWEKNVSEIQTGSGGEGVKPKRGSAKVSQQNETEKLPRFHGSDSSVDVVDASKKHRFKAPPTNLDGFITMELTPVVEEEQKAKGNDQGSNISDVSSVALGAGKNHKSIIKEKNSLRHWYLNGPRKEQNQQLSTERDTATSDSKQGRFKMDAALKDVFNDADLREKLAQERLRQHRQKQQELISLYERNILKYEGVLERYREKLRRARHTFQDDVKYSASAEICEVQNGAVQNGVAQNGAV